MTKSIQVQINNAKNQPLISVFEGNFDFDEVAVNRTEYAIKAIVPLEFFIQAASVYLFEKFILAPLLDPIADKFDWTQGVRKYLKPFQSFSLVVHLENDNMLIEASLDTNHHITEKIWKIIHKTLAIIKNENIHLSKIRFSVEVNGELMIIGYDDNRPAYIIDIDSEKITRMST